MEVLAGVREGEEVFLKLFERCLVLLLHLFLLTTVLQFRGLLAELLFNDYLLVASHHQIRVLHKVESEILQRGRCHSLESLGGTTVVFDYISEPGSLGILL